MLCMANPMSKIKAPPVRRAEEVSWWTTLPHGARLHSVHAFLTVKAGGVAVTLGAHYEDQDSRPGWLAKDVSARWEARYHILTPQRPTVGTLLRVLSHSAWDMSTSPQAMHLDGQDPLPGL